MLQTDFPKGCLGTKECAMAARIDLGSNLQDATLTYRCAPTASKWFNHLQQ